MEQKIKHLGLRVTLNNYIKILQQSANSGMSITEYLEYLILPAVEENRINRHVEKSLFADINTHEDLLSAAQERLKKLKNINNK